MFVQAALLSPPYTTLTYSLPDFLLANTLTPGTRLCVPLGNSLRAALTLKTETSAPPGISCKNIVFPLEASPLMDYVTFDMILNLASRQGILPGLIAGHILSAGLRSTSVKLNYGGKNIALNALKALPHDQLQELYAKLRAGAAFFVKSAREGSQKGYCYLNCDPPWPLRPSAKRQIALLDLLFENGAMPVAALLKKAGAGFVPPLQKLAEANFVTIIQDDTGAENNDLLPPPPLPFILTQDQTNTLAQLEDALFSSKPESRLVYGVTGSGKTAIYIELTKKCLANGKSAFILAPEVALAHKLRRDFQIALPDVKIFFYHGYQTASCREKTWREIANYAQPCIALGTRSALFLPLRNSGCIIIDEEHDGSYKQDEVFPYHAKELAWFRTLQTNGLLILGSATPDLKSFYAAETGKLPILRLDKRVGGNKLPPVELVNISAYSGIGADASGFGILAKESETALQECVNNGDQAVILLNRRGYSPMIYCLDCAKTLTCPNCSIGLAYHKGLRKLLCHFCGYSRPWPSACPECGKTNFLPIGEGTERIAERLEVLAGQPVLRLDRDSSRRKGSVEDILTSFANQASPFLTGTQMLSKGHHFPNVTLVVVADGDIGLNLPDYRAAERTFQLLVQAAGRAGRGEKPGRVLIQTRNPNHYCWEYIRNYDFEGFYANELLRRKKSLYPPFTKLALLRISHPATDINGPAAVTELGKHLKKACPEFGVKLLGPAPAPIPMLNGRKRYQCLMKSEKWQSFRQTSFFAKNLACAAPLALFLDLDPVNML